jgi:hypothetical protein
MVAIGAAVAFARRKVALIKPDGSKSKDLHDLTFRKNWAKPARPYPQSRNSGRKKAGGYLPPAPDGVR